MTRYTLTVHHPNLKQKEQVYHGVEVFRRGESTIVFRQDGLEMESLTDAQEYVAPGSGVGSGAWGVVIMGIGANRRRKVWKLER